MKNSLYTFLSVIIAVIFTIIIFLYPYFEIHTSSDIAGMPRRYYDVSASFYNLPVFPFLFLGILYTIVQVFICLNIKQVYKTFKRLRITIYILSVVISVPFILFPYLYIVKYHELLVEGLNPFLGQIVYLPICFQIWIWIDMLIKILMTKKNIHAAE